MVRHAIRFVVMAVQLIVACVLGWRLYVRIASEQEIYRRIADRPSFVFHTPDGAAVSTDQAVGRPLWLVFFHTSCEYCWMEASNIRQDRSLREVQIWMISPEPADSLRSFAALFRLDTLDHVQFLQDTTYSGHTFFGVASTPSSFLYSAQGTLIRSFKGTVQTETVYKALEGFR